MKKNKTLIIIAIIVLFWAFWLLLSQVVNVDMSNLNIKIDKQEKIVMEEYKKKEAAIQKHKEANVELAWLWAKKREYMWNSLIDFKSVREETPKTITGIVEISTWVYAQENVEITGKTVDEKTLSYLQMHWMGLTYNTWKKYWKLYNIKYSVAICIAKADSNLGKQLKTSYNIGNVWNNDGWDKVHYDNWDDWIRAIFRTLNWKYIKWNNVIWDLSQGWRIKMDTKWCTEDHYSRKCYASSIDNWNRNVLRCLNSIYNQPKDEYFKFRTK